VGRARFTMLVALLVALAGGVGCARDISTGNAEGDSTSRWDPRALEEAAPCLLSLAPDSQGRRSLRAFGLDGGAGVNVWTADAQSSPVLMDVDEAGTRVLVSLSPESPIRAGDIADTVRMLQPDGAISDVSPPTADYPFVSSGVLIGEDALVLRRHESAESIDTTLSMVSPSGASVSVRVSGAVPDNDHLAGLVRIPGSERIALVFKTAGTPAPHDDFAVVATEYEDGQLEVVSGPYYDDALFTLAPGAGADRLVFVRNQTPSGGTDIIELDLSQPAIAQRILLSSANADPGFDNTSVVGGGGMGATLFRSAESTAGPVGLRAIEANASEATDTGLAFPPLGDQWRWVAGAR